MKYILILLLVLTSLQADKVKRKAFACPSVEILQKAPLDKGDNYLDLNMYAISNNCVILSRSSSIEALGYDPRNSKEIYQEIIYKKTGAHLFVRRSAIQVEQPGKIGKFIF